MNFRVVSHAFKYETVKLVGCSLDYLNNRKNHLLEINQPLPYQNKKKTMMIVLLHTYYELILPNMTKAYNLPCATVLNLSRRKMKGYCV